MSYKYTSAAHGHAKPKPRAASVYVVTPSGAGHAKRKAKARVRDRRSGRHLTLVPIGGLGLGAVPVSVGSLASRDIVVSSASLIASQIIRKASTAASAAGQLRVIRAEANKIQSGLAQRFNDQYRLLAAKGARGTQVTFNALRLVIANVLADKAVEQIRAMVAAVGGSALGQTTPPDYTGTDISCGIMSGLSAITGIVGSITKTTTTDAAGSIGTAANTFCGARTAANTQAQIDAQNQQTAANLAAAQANAATQQAAIAADQAKQGTMVKLALVGGGVLLLGIIGVVVVKKI
jgi:hypothetical protein